MRTVTVICLEQGKPTCTADKLGGGPEAKQTRWTEKPAGPPKGSCGGQNIGRAQLKPAASLSLETAQLTPGTENL